MDRSQATGFLSLAYDAARPSHRSVAFRQLSQRSLRATFYLDPTAALEDVRRWREISDAGHEIGNGCLCSSARLGGKLEGWTLAMIQEEIEEAEIFLSEVFGSGKPHSFGYPWGTPCCSESSDYRDVVATLGAVARSGEFGFNSPGSMDDSYLLTLFGAGKVADELIRTLKEPLSKGQWCIVSFNGIGEGERSMAEEEHEAFCAWVQEEMEPDHVAPVVEIAEHLRTMSRVER